MRNLLAIVAIVASSTVFSQFYCWDNSPYPSTHPTDVSADDITYPVGQAFMTTGAIEVVKTDTLSEYLAIAADSLVYEGWVSLVVSTSNCTTNELSFVLFDSDTIVVDQDTFHLPLAGTEYYGATYFVQWETGNNYTITGEFDTVSIHAEFQRLSSVCLRECSSAASVCMDFAKYDLAYLNSSSADHITYPIGDTLMSYGYFNFIKIDSFTTFSSALDDKICLDGALLLDVGEFPYHCKTLTMDLFLPQILIIDGDTVYSLADPALNYSGTDFTVTTNGSNLYTVEGKFEQISAIGTSFCWEDICIEECHYPPSFCLNFGIYDSTYLDAINTDHLTYPVGSTIMEGGDFELFKVNTTTVFDYTTPDSLCFNGDIGISVRTSPFNCRSVVLQGTGIDGVTVDGDNVFNLTVPPGSYSGSNFDFVSNGLDSMSIEGSFDTIHVYGTAVCIRDLCFEECGFKTSQCLDLSAWDDAYVNTVSIDDVTYPVASPFITDGFIQLVKTSATATYTQIINDSILFSEGIIVDVSLAPYGQRKLDCRSSLPMNVWVDGIEVASGVISVGSYAGDGWELSVGTDNDYELWGSFDQFALYGGNNYLDNVCLYEYSTVAIEPLESSQIKVYPNPTSDRFTIEGASGEVMHITSIDGKTALQVYLTADQQEVDISLLDAGIYLLVIQDLNGEKWISRLVKR